MMVKRAVLPLGSFLRRVRSVLMSHRPTSSPSNATMRSPPWTPAAWAVPPATVSRTGTPCTPAVFAQANSGGYAAPLRVNSPRGALKKNPKERLYPRPKVVSILMVSAGASSISNMACDAAPPLGGLLVGELPCAGSESKARRSSSGSEPFRITPSVTVNGQSENNTASASGAIILTSTPCTWVSISYCLTPKLAAGDSGFTELTGTPPKPRAKLTSPGKVGLCLRSA
mmetsp:Transcript_61077/g.132653  ORF Transcript_61077/g.132653 Transcript_61077/m.132653 type:complete len:228 (-) Transcript_61077:383-1066(-)